MPGQTTGSVPEQTIQATGSMPGQTTQAVPGQTTQMTESVPGQTTQATGSVPRQTTQPDNASEPPMTTGLTDTPPSPESSSNIVGGALGGIFVGILVGVAITVVFIILVFIKHRSKKEQDQGRGAFENAMYSGGKVISLRVAS